LWLQARIAVVPKLRRSGWFARTEGSQQPAVTGRRRNFGGGEETSSIDFPPSTRVNRKKGRVRAGYRGGASPGIRLMQKGAVAPQPRAPRLPKAGSRPTASSTDRRARVRSSLARRKGAKGMAGQWRIAETRLFDRRSPGSPIGAVRTGRNADARRFYAALYQFSGFSSAGNLLTATSKTHLVRRHAGRIRASGSRFLRKDSLAVPPEL